MNKLMLISKFDFDMFNDEFNESKNKTLVRLTLLIHFILKDNRRARQINNKSRFHSFAEGIAYNEKGL